MNKNCSRCGKEVEKGRIHCSHCLSIIDPVKQGRIWLFAGPFSAVMLVLAGMLLWHGQAATWDLSWERLTGRPIAIINGEPIDRKDFLARLAANRRILEQQYGPDIIVCKEGQDSLLLLQKQLLDRMIEERLIAQEAKHLGIFISNERVDQELLRIVGEIYGSQDNFQKSSKEDGLAEEGLKNHIRTILVAQSVMKMKSDSHDQGLQKDLLDAWLMQAKKAAKIVVYDFSEGSGRLLQSGGCCSTGIQSLEMSHHKK